MLGTVPWPLLTGGTANAPSQAETWCSVLGSSVSSAERSFLTLKPLLCFLKML